MEEQLMIYRRRGTDAAYLTGCALRDEIPTLREDMDLEGLYAFCSFHSITSIVAMALDAAWKTAPGEDAMMKKWRHARDMAIRKNILLNAERQRILAYLESIGCWYMPLKGSFLQFDYPRFGMRQMSDNDILYDESRTQEVYDFMTSNGYHTDTYLKYNHEEYVKPPLYNMEMHRSLFISALNPEIGSYYLDVKSRLIKDEGNQFGYHFSKDDFYIYMIAHAYKHYMDGGVGIRNLLDVHVYTEKYKDCLDWHYLEKELRRIGAWDFSEECRMLSRKIFSEPGAKLSDAELLTLDVYYTSGAYGTRDRLTANHVQKGMEKHSGNKLGYILKRMFPTVDYMAENYPILRKLPWLVPVFYIRRFFVTLLQRRSAVLKEVSVLRKKKK